MKTKTTKRTLDTMTVVELNERFDALVQKGAESWQLQEVSDAITAAEGREAEDKDTRSGKRSPKVEAKRRVTIASSQVTERRTQVKATAAGYKVDTGTFSILLDRAPLAYVHVVPFLSVPGRERVEAERSRYAIGVLYNLVERHAANKVTNARAKSMGMAPTLPESRAELVARIKWDLADAIAAGIVEIA